MMGEIVKFRNPTPYNNPKFYNNLMAVPLGAYFESDAIGAAKRYEEYERKRKLIAKGVRRKHDTNALASFFVKKYKNWAVEYGLANYTWKILGDYFNVAFAEGYEYAQLHGKAVGV